MSVSVSVTDSVAINVSNTVLVDVVNQSIKIESNEQTKVNVVDSYVVQPGYKMVTTDYVIPQSVLDGYQVQINGLVTSLADNYQALGVEIAAVDSKSYTKDYVDGLIVQNYIDLEALYIGNSGGYAISTNLANYSVIDDTANGGTTVTMQEVHNNTVATTNATASITSEQISLANEQSALALTVDKLEATTDEGLSAVQESNAIVLAGTFYEWDYVTTPPPMGVWKSLDGAYYQFIGIPHGDLRDGWISISANTITNMTIAASNIDTVEQLRIDVDKYESASGLIEAGLADGTLTIYTSGTEPQDATNYDLWRIDKQYVSIDDWGSLDPEVTYISDDEYIYKYYVNGTWEWATTNQVTMMKSALNIVSLEDLADAKVRIFNVEPIAPYDSGDIWIKDGDMLMSLYSRSGDQTTGSFYTESDWVTATKYTDDSLAETKATTFAQVTQPIALAIGDFWINTNEGNKLYRWDGDIWASVQDSAITDASAAAALAIITANTAINATDGTITVYYVASDPKVAGSPVVIGDIWVDIDSVADTAYRWRTDELDSIDKWILIADTVASAALVEAQNATITADGKIVAYYITTAEKDALTLGASDIGDIAYVTDNGDNHPYYWDGTTWQDIQDAVAVSAATDAAQALTDIGLLTGSFEDYVGDNVITVAEKVEFRRMIAELNSDFDVIDEDVAHHALTLNVDYLTYKDTLSLLNTYLDTLISINDESVDTPVEGTKINDYVSDIVVARGSLLLLISNLSNTEITDIDGAITNLSAEYNNFLDVTYDALQTQVDEKIDSFYQDTTPYADATAVAATAIDTRAILDNKLGDMWYDSGVDKKSYLYVKTVNSIDNTASDYTWTEMEISQEVFDVIDSKKTIYGGAIDPVDVLDPNGLALNAVAENDIWMPASDVLSGTTVLYIKGEIYQYLSGVWTISTSYSADISSNVDDLINTATADGAVTDMLAQSEFTLYTSAPTNPDAYDILAVSLDDILLDDRTSVTYDTALLSDSFDWGNSEPLINVDGVAYRYYNPLTEEWTMCTPTMISAIKDVARVLTVEALADNKSRVFRVTPYAPYDEGDIWFDTSGNLLTAETARTANELYYAGDWVRATVYTDDTLAEIAHTEAKVADAKANDVQIDVNNISKDSVLDKTEKPGLILFMNDSKNDAKSTGVYLLANSTNGTYKGYTNVTNAFNAYVLTYNATIVFLEALGSDNETAWNDASGLTNIDRDAFNTQVKALSTAKQNVYDTITANSAVTYTFNIADSTDESWTNVIGAKTGDMSIVRFLQTGTTTTVTRVYTALQNSPIDIGDWDRAESELAGWAGGASSFTTSDVNDPSSPITGWKYSDGSAAASEFTIMADNFKVASADGSAIPFSIEYDPVLSTTDVHFNGKVEIGSSYVNLPTLHYNNIVSTVNTTTLGAFTTEVYTLTDVADGMDVLISTTTEAYAGILISDPIELMYDVNKLYKITVVASGIPSSEADLGLNLVVMSYDVNGTLINDETIASSVVSSLDGNIELIGFISGEGNQSSISASNNSVSTPSVFSVGISSFNISIYTNVVPSVTYEFKIKNIKVEEIPDIAAYTMFNEKGTIIDGKNIITGSLSADKIRTGIIYDSDSTNIDGSLIAAATYKMKIDLNSGFIHIQ